MVNAGYFRDDRGREFNFVGKPRVASRAATGVLSLYHMGMREDQITASYGLWFIRGSDLDVGNPEAGSRYEESDPNPEEVEFLSGLINLSPSCYTNPRGCTRWDNTSIVEQYKSEFDYILFIDNGNDPTHATIEEETGIPVVFLDTFYEYSPDCRFYNFSLTEERKENCFGRSMIDIAKRVEELAIALGADVDTVRIESDKQAACEAAYEFTDTMKQKQEEGLRFVTSINAIRKDDDGNDYFEFRSLDPIDLWIPRTLEELGMPLLHHDEHSLTLETISTKVSSSEYFVDCPEGELSVDCNSNTMYPVDFWLWDSRSYLNIIGVDTVVLESLFPDKAILAGQHWHYARNDGAVSYNTIARMLTTMTEKVKGAQRMHDRTPCVNIDPKTAVTAQRGGGLDRNEYICYNESLIQKEYLTCDRPASNEDIVGGDGGFNLCFSGENMVESMGRGLVMMKTIKIGDFVRVRGGKFAKVYSFGHFEKNIPSDYLQIRSAGAKAPLEISADHMVFVYDGGVTKSVPASTISVGDNLASETGPRKVLSIKDVKRDGAYAPFTTSGDIVVSGIVASNYISLIPEQYIGLPVTMQWIAHSFKAPHRAVCSINFSICENETYINGLSIWIYGPYKAATLLARQHTMVKIVGTTVFIASMLACPLVCVVALGFLLSKLNKTKVKVL